MKIKKIVKPHTLCTFYDIIYDNDISVRHLLVHYMESETWVIWQGNNFSQYFYSKKQAIGALTNDTINWRNL